MFHSLDRVLQEWVSVYDTNYVVGSPSVAETKKFMLKHRGVLEAAAKDCYQDRRNKVKDWCILCIADTCAHIADTCAHIADTCAHIGYVSLRHIVLLVL